MPNFSCYMHRFDKLTHRCKCGRWQPGFKPKKEPVKPLDECQICERKQAMDKDGTLGHHGYKRPGWGFIQGDCMGEGHKPYPATDALVKYLAAVEAYILRCKEALIELPTIPGLPYTVQVGRSMKRENRKVSVIRGAESFSGGIWGDEGGHPSFEYLEKVEKARLENEIIFASNDRTRVIKRIEAAKEFQTK